MFLGTDTDLLCDNFVRPKIKVGAEWVVKGQNTAQVIYLIQETVVPF